MPKGKDSKKAVALLGRTGSHSAQILRVVYDIGPAGYGQYDGRRLEYSPIINMGRDDPSLGYLIPPPELLKQAASNGIVYWIGEGAWKYCESAAGEAFEEILVGIQPHAYQGGFFFTDSAGALHELAIRLSMKLVWHASHLKNTDERLEYVTLAMQMNSFSRLIWAARYQLALDDAERAILRKEFAHYFPRETLE